MTFDPKAIEEQLENIEQENQEDQEEPVNVVEETKQENEIDVEQFDISVDLQRDLLNLILTDRNFLINSLRLVNPEYFKDIAHKAICRTCQNHFNEYNSPITADVLTQELTESYRENRQLPRMLAEADIISDRTEQAYQNKEYYERIVSRFAKAQAMRMAIVNSVDLIDTGEYEKIEANIREALLVAPNVSLGINIFENVKERYRKILAEAEGEKYTTGWPTVDRDLNGGMGRKEIGLIFANSGVGKSLWLAKVGVENLIKGKRVLYISCEMSEERVAERIDSMITRIPINELIYKIPEVESRINELKKCLNTHIQVKEFPAGEATITDFKAYANQLYNYTGFRPDLVLLDYIDEVKCSNSRLSTYEGQYHTLREFRAWMQSEDLGGYTATQANRMGREVQVIDEGQIGDSYAKIRVTDLAWSLNQTDEEYGCNLARLFVVKHRGARGRYLIWVKIDPHTLKMSEITESEYESILGGPVPTDVAGEENL